MKTIAMTIALLGIAASAAAQSNNEVMNFRQPVAGVVTNPCSGEPVTFAGECHVVTHTRSGDGTTVTTHTNCHGEGLGFLGDRYTFGSNSSSRTETACGTSQRFREMARFISPRSTQNFFLTISFVVTVDENCQPHVVVDETEATCKGRSGGF